jgi:hypothetical protein
MKFALNYILYTFTVLILSFYSVGSWDQFKDTCPNHDFLTWDENLRMGTAIEQYTHFRDGEIWEGIFPFLDSPTWPPLRGLISLFLLTTGGDWYPTWKESFTGLFFYGVTIITSGIVGYAITGVVFYGLAIAIVLSAILPHTLDIPSYSLSGMLETQSMTMEIFSIYAIFQVFQNPKDKKNRILFSIATVGFFFTKYPYGLMLYLSLFVSLCFIYWEEVWNFVIFSFKNHYKGIRLILPSLLGIFLVGLLSLQHSSEINLNQKSFKMGVFVITFLFLIEFNYYLYKFRTQISEILPGSAIVFYLYGFLPSLIWIYTNPSRLNSLLDAQLIKNPYIKSFFLSLVLPPNPGSNIQQNVFDYPILFILTISIGIGSTLYWLFVYQQNIQRSLPSQALGFVWIVVFFQIFILETTTGNKQLRHIFQFVPILFTLSLVSLFLLVNELRDRKFDSFAGIFVILLLVVLILPNGLLTGNYFNTHYFCLRGDNPNLFQPAREVKKHIEREKKYIIMNGFHEYSNFDKPLRLLASDFDLQIKIKTYKFGKAISDNSYHVPSWRGYDHLLYISYDCKDPVLDGKLAKRVEKLNVKLLNQKTLIKEKTYCAKQWDIK